MTVPHPEMSDDELQEAMTAHDAVLWWVYREHPEQKERIEAMLRPLTAYLWSQYQATPAMTTWVDQCRSWSRPSP